MTREDIIPFEIAKKLKEKGFREECFARYDCNDTAYFEINSYNQDTENVFYCYNNDEDLSQFYIDAPSISQVLKWLRDEFFFHISQKPYPCEDGLMWMYEIRKFNKYIVFVIANKTGFVEEEEASLVGIKYVLDNLI